MRVAHILTLQNAKKPKKTFQMLMVSLRKWNSRALVWNTVIRLVDSLKTQFHSCSYPFAISSLTRLTDLIEIKNIYFFKLFRFCLLNPYLWIKDKKPTFCTIITLFWCTLFHNVYLSEAKIHMKIMCIRKSVHYCHNVVFCWIPMLCHLVSGWTVQPEPHESVPLV